MEGYCLVCGDSTVDTVNSNSEKEPSSQGQQTLFQCFLKIFEVINPPLFEKRFAFCEECKGQLTLVSELEQALKELEKRLRESQKVVYDKFNRSESRFKEIGLYEKDHRYCKVGLLRKGKVKPRCLKYKHHVLKPEHESWNLQSFILLN